MPKFGFHFKFIFVMDTSNKGFRYEWTGEELAALDSRYRAQLVNSLSGYKSANLVATRDLGGVSNLAIFSSVVHLGADPALVGMITRPAGLERRRHTVENIEALGYYTLNQVGCNFYERAHQTSAHYPSGVSEFGACGFEEVYYGDFPVPFVGEARLQMGLRLVELVPIRHNGTSLIIGQIELLRIEGYVFEDGLVDLADLDAVCLSGLDRYHRPVALGRLPYAKP